MLYEVITKFSWQYTTVCALLDGKVTMTSFEDAHRFSPAVEALLDNGADPDIKDTAYGRSAMHIAASKDYDKIASAVITSYSIHYTKLYDISESPLPAAGTDAAGKSARTREQIKMIG